jgi:hypothetical protein
MPATMYVIDRQQLLIDNIVWIIHITLVSIVGPATAEQQQPPQ